MFSKVQSQQYSCPGLHYQWVRIYGSNIVSVGFQNSGLAQNFSASQMFTDNEGAFVQVINSSFTSTDWWVWTTVSTTGEAAELKYEVESAPIEKS